MESNNDAAVGFNVINRLFVTFIPSETYLIATLSPFLETFLTN